MPDPGRLLVLGTSPETSDRQERLMNKHFYIARANGDAYCGQPIADGDRERLPDAPTACADCKSALKKTVTKSVAVKL